LEFFVTDVVTDVNVRPARSTDLSAVGELWSQLVKYHQELDPRLPSPQPNGPLYYARQLEDRLSDPLVRLLVAEVDGQVVGYVLGMVVDLMGDLFVQYACGFLADIFVVSEYRRVGVGRKLVDALVDWFRDEKVSYYEWHVAAQNPPGQAFWNAMQGDSVLVRMRADIREK